MEPEPRLAPEIRAAKSGACCLKPSRRLPPDFLSTSHNARVRKQQDKIKQNGRPVTIIRRYRSFPNVPMQSIFFSWQRGASLPNSATPDRLEKPTTRRPLFFLLRLHNPHHGTQTGNNQQTVSPPSSLFLVCATRRHAITAVMACIYMRPPPSARCTGRHCAILPSPVRTARSG